MHCVNDVVTIDDICFRHGSAAQAATDGTAAATAAAA